MFLFVEVFFLKRTKQARAFWGLLKCFISSQNKPTHFTALMYEFTVTAVVNIVKELAGDVWRSKGHKPINAVLN